MTQAQNAHPTPSESEQCAGAPRPRQSGREGQRDGPGGREWGTGIPESSEGPGAHSPPNCLRRSSAARMMVHQAQRTLSMMTLRARPGRGCLESGATCPLSPATWPTLLC